MQKKQVLIVAIIVAVILIAALTLQTNWFDRLFGGNDKDTTEPSPTTEGIVQTNSAQSGTASREQMLLMDRAADPNGVAITITNQGKDKIALSATVSEGKRNVQGYAEIDPNETKTLKLEFPQLKAKETLTLAYRVGTVSGDRNEDVSKTLSEDAVAIERENSKELADAWNQGTFETVYESIDYHFKKHGEEVDAKNIVDYLDKSVAFQNQILADRKKMKQSELEKTYTIKESSGKLPAHKYKHKKDKRYAILTDEDGRILSFGK